MRKKYVVVLAAVFLFFGCTETPETPVPPEPEVPEETVEELQEEGLPEPTVSVTYRSDAHATGTVPDASEYEEGRTVMVEANPGDLSRPGFRFAGWNTASDGDGITYEAGDTFTLGPDDVTLYALWEHVPTYTLTYRANGADSGSVPVDETEYQSGRQITVKGNPGNLRRAGHLFARWNTAPDGSGTYFSQGDTIAVGTSDLELYAQWSTVAYTVTFNTHGGSAVPSQTLGYEERVTAPTVNPRREGYGFRGWYADAGYNVPWDFEARTVSANTTIHARWQINEYSVTFNTHGGSAVSARTVDFGNTVREPRPVPVREGHTFRGWYGDSEYRQPWSFRNNTVRGTLTLHARWTINEYEVAFDSGGGSAVPSQSVTHNGHVVQPGPAPTRTGHTFLGWYSDAEHRDRWDFRTGTVNEDTTLYAAWRINTYPIVFDSRGGSSVPPRRVDHGTRLIEPVPAPSRDGHTLRGWYADAAYTRPWNFTTAVVQEPVTLYARWSIHAYSIEFDTRGGSPVSPLDVDHGVIVAEPTPPTRDGHTFRGWYLDAEYRRPWDFAAGSVRDDLTLYARWTIDRHRVVFETAGGSPVPAQTVTYGERVTEPELIPTRDGYTFQGWYGDTDHDVPWDFAEPVRQDGTIYARWSVDTYTVRYLGNFHTGGDIPVEPTGHEAGSTVTVHGNTGELVKRGYTYLGWDTRGYVREPRYMAGDTFPMQARDVTLYAIWEEYIFTLGEQRTYRVEETEFHLRYAPTLEFPTGLNDRGVAAIERNYFIGETPVAYDLWYAVRLWAEEQGYRFLYPGQEGSNGIDGAPPVPGTREPVTRVSWRDAIVWLNALSEKLDYRPVYTYNNQVIRDATDETATDNARAVRSNGFRLPTMNEWEQVARYRGTDASGGAIEYPRNSGVFWTPGSNASGAMGDVRDSSATAEAAWFNVNSEGGTRPVGQRPVGANALNLFDLSGNVWEWNYNWHPEAVNSLRVVRGGSWYLPAEYLRIAELGSYHPGYVSSGVGFRIARSMNYERPVP